MPALGTAIAAAATAFSASGVGVFLTQNFVGRLLSATLLSSLARALGPKPSQPGIVTQYTQDGATHPLSFILGSYATAGDLVCPPMAHGTAGKTPNAYRTLVISIGDIDRMAVTGYLINGEPVTLGTVAHADYGLPVLGKYEGYAWLKVLDGTQTTADAMLMAKYGAAAQRPWQSDMIGTGVTLCICTFRLNRELFNSDPTVLFVTSGIPLYDPRLDSTVGGSGAHRWTNRATWAPSNNPFVQIYNVKRGITLPGLGVWGTEVAAEDLPLSNWFACMNACDASVTHDTGVVEPAFRSGIEVTVDAEPAAVIAELLKACTGQLAEVGGVWKGRVGAPGLPVYFMSDSDIIVTKGGSRDPHKPIKERFNAVIATGPDPSIGWQPRPAPLVTNATWEAEDGGRQLLAELNLPACPYPNQTQRVSQTYIKDERRGRAHSFSLPPDAAILEPLDVLSWTSTRFGYAAKQFDAGRIVDDARTLIQGLAVRESDPADYSWVSGTGVVDPPPSIVPVTLPAQAVPGFALVGALIADASGRARVAGIDATWDAVDLDNVDGIEFEFRDDVTNVVVARVSTTNIEAGRLTVTAGMLPSTAYEGRARLVINRPRTWTAWTAVTTPAAYIVASEIEAAVIADIDAAQATADSAAAAAAAVTANHNALVSGFTGTLAAAFSSVQQMAEAAGNGWLVDPYFADWSAATTLNMNNWSEGGNPTYQTKMTDGYGGGVSTIIPSGAAFSHFVAGVAANDGLVGVDTSAPAVTVSLEFDLTAGSLTDQYLYAQWSADGTTWTSGLRNGSTSAARFSDRGISVIPGVKQLIQEIWTKPAGSFPYFRLVYLPKISGATSAVNIKTYLLNVRESTQAEIDIYKTYTVATATNGATSTVQGIGAALAQVSTSLNAQVGATNANLSTNYMTSASTNAALAAMQTSLSSAISRSDACFPQYNDVTRTNWNTGPSVGINSMYPSGSDLTFTASAVGTNTGMYVASNIAGWNGPKNERAFLVEMDATLVSGVLQGACVLVHWYNTLGTVFPVNIKLSDMVPYVPLAGLAFRASYVFQRPTGFTGTFSHVVAYAMGNYPGGIEAGAIKTLTMHRFAVYPASATDNMATSLNASVTSILGTNVSALTGTALGTLLTQLSVSGGGTSALLTNQGTVIADLQGNASASYTFGVQAGSAGAVVELVAANNVAGGPVSSIKIAAQNVDIQAESLRISNGGNLWPDFNMTSKNFYAGDPFTLVAVQNQNLGTQSISIAANAAQQITTSSLFAVDPGTQFSVSALSWLTGGTGTMAVDIQLYDATDTLIRTLSNVSTNTDLAVGAVTRQSLDVTTAANECKARFRFRRLAGGTGAGRAGGLRVEKKIGASLLVQGSAIITGTAQMGTAVVDTLNVAGNAISAVLFAQNGNVEFSSTSSWAELCRITITRRAGFSTSFVLSVRYGLADQGAISLELRNGASVIWSANQSSAWQGHMDTFTATCFDNDKSAGVTTYKLFARKTGTDGGGCDVYRTHMIAQQFVR